MQYVAVQDSVSGLDTDIVIKVIEAVELEVAAAKGLDSEPYEPCVDGNVSAVGTTYGER